MMKKNSFFSTQRFLNLCLKEMVENWKINALRMVMMYGVMTILFLWIGYFKYQTGTGATDPMVSKVLNLMLFIGSICGFLSASFNMSSLKSKTGRISTLMLPATPFEKFFSRWVLSTIVYILAFMLVFKLADYTRVLVYSFAFPDSTVAIAKIKYLFATGGEYALFTQTSAGVKRFMLLHYLLFQSFFILGSSVWPKNSFLKTFATGIAMHIAYLLFIIVFMNILFGGTSVQINEPNEALTNFMTNGNSQITHILTTAAIVFILLNWTLAYYRFKESEIINRF